MFLFGKRKANYFEFADDELIGSFIPPKPLKLGYVITVPEGRMCYVCYRDNVYYSYQAGRYTLDYETIPKLLAKQEHRSIFTSAKKDTRVKKFTADFYFPKVKESGRIEYNFRWKKFKLEDKTKTNLEVNLVVYFEMYDARKFMDALLDELAIIRAGDARKYLTGWLRDDCKEYIYLHPLQNITSKYDTEYANKFQKFLNKEYNAIGINISSLEIGFAGTRALEPQIVELPSITQIQEENPQLKAENLPKIADNSQANLSHKKYCPRCQTELIENASFCHKCGLKM